MTFDVTQSVQQAFTEFLAGIFGNEQQALAFAQDPNGVLDAEGLTSQDLTGLNVQQAVVDACNYPGVPDYVAENLQSYSYDSYAAPQTIEDVVTQVTEVTQIVYQDNDVINQEIQQNINNINAGDNSNINVDNVNVDDGGVANTGSGNVNAATGDGAQAIDDSIVGAANTGDGAVTAGDDINAPVNTGTNTGILADGDVTGANTGVNSGVVAGGDVDNAVTGTNNQVGVQATDGANVEDNVTGFGSGNITSVNDSQVQDSAIGGEDATNVSGNSLTEGSAISTGGSASGSFEDNDTTTTTSDDDITTTNETNTSSVTDSVDVNTEQGDGDQSNEDDVSVAL